MSSTAGVEPALDVLETSAPSSSIDDTNPIAKSVPKKAKKINTISTNLHKTLISINFQPIIPIKIIFLKLKSALFF